MSLPLGKYIFCESHDLYFCGIKCPLCVAEIERDLREKDYVRMRKALNECNHKLSLRHNKIAGKD